MRNLRCLFLMLILGLNSMKAQLRYKEEVFNSLERQTLEYSQGLLLDFYAPKGDTQTARPLLLLVHGGGFAAGQRDGAMEKEFMETMAKKGYATAAISYRLLRKDKGFGCDCPAAEKELTFLAAAEDIYKATLFLRGKAVSLGIDPNTIILIGSSAGAESVLNAAFMQQQFAYKSILKTPINYAGVVSFAGAILDASQITKNNAIPSLFFHGKRDRLVPYRRAPHHYCKKKDPGFLVLEGSKTIARKIRKNKEFATVAKDPHGNHDWANIPYSKTDLIADFINTVILEKGSFKKRIKIRATKRLNP